MKLVYNPKAARIADAEAAIEAAQQALADLKDAPPDAPASEKAWHSGLKVYGAAALTIALACLMMWHGDVSIATGVNTICGALIAAGFRSTLKSMEATHAQLAAQIADAVKPAATPAAASGVPTTVELPAASASLHAGLFPASPAG